MNQVEKANIFNRLHVKGTPIILYNAWDSGSGKAIQDAGASAIATSSWAIAAAHGYEDGEVIPLDMVIQIVGRMASTLNIPLTADFEGGYSNDLDKLATNALKLLDAGVAGINFEDRVVSGHGLYEIKQQTMRIATIRKAAKQRGIPLFINARTDVFFGAAAPSPTFMEDALMRATAYAEAGASGFFVPGLLDEALLEELCKASPLPINIMVSGTADLSKFFKLGVARISLGPVPFLNAMKIITQSAVSLYEKDSHSG